MRVMRYPDVKDECSKNTLCLLLQIRSYVSSFLDDRLLVGAPRAQSSQPGTNHSGVVFKCSLSTLHDDCIPLRFDQDEKGNPVSPFVDLQSLSSHCVNCLDLSFPPTHEQPPTHQFQRMTSGSESQFALRDQVATSWWVIDGELQAETLDSCFQKIEWFSVHWSNIFSLLLWTSNGTGLCSSIRVEGSRLPVGSGGLLLPDSVSGLSEDVGALFQSSGEQSTRRVRLLSGWNECRYFGRERHCDRYTWSLHVERNDLYEFNSIRDARRQGMVLRTSGWKCSCR